MTTPPTGAKVIVVGGGIAGPVLATFLKLKGYNPVIYERTAGIDDNRGIGHGASPIGLAVLAKIDGLLDSLECSQIDNFRTYSMVETDKRLLNDGIPGRPGAPPGGAGLRPICVRRSALHKAVVNAATRHGVEIKWGHKLVAVEQREAEAADARVSVVFENGTRDDASFVVGCDGLHSNTRSCLFGEEKADYTGLIQIGGICPTPESLKNQKALINVFGIGAHMIGFPISKTHSGWAVTMKQPEALKETWNAVDTRVADEIRNSSVAGWDFGAGDLIQNTESFVKYGLYDRPELHTWHKGRVLLIGDAAHPTSPHLGQGATQAFEDVDALVSLLEKHNPAATELDTLALQAIFAELEAERIPRTAAQVKAARRMGEVRVVDGLQAALKRNSEYVAMLKDETSARRTYGRA